MEPNEESAPGSRPAESTAADRQAADPRLRPYRNWALQNNLISALGDDKGWSEDPDMLGLVEADLDPAGTTDRGQGFLLGELETDPKFKLRAQTASLLWAIALMTVALCQWTPFGVNMDPTDFMVTFWWIAGSLFYSSLIHPRLSAGPYVVMEQAMITWALAVIVFQCRATGGAESPYMVWWLLVTFYNGHLVPTRRAYVNLVASSVCLLAPLAYDATAFAGSSILMLLLLLTVVWAMSLTLISRRREVVRMEATVRMLALADPPTGVANRRSFERFVSGATAKKDARFALVIADLDGLKGANVAFGYDVGDDMIRRMALLMRYASDDRAQVARIRGDEFAVLLPDADESTAFGWCDRLARAVVAHNEWIRGRLPRISYSFGLAVYPRDGASVEELIDIADRRMLDRKQTAVRPPHEVDMSVSEEAERLLRAPEIHSGMYRDHGIDKRSRQAAIKLAVGAVVMFAAAFTPDVRVLSDAALIALGGLALTLAAARVAFRRSRWNGMIVHLADWTALALVPGAMLLSGGWQSPLQIAIFFPLADYTQHIGNRRAISRMPALVALWSAAFWLSEPLGAAPAPVSPAGETFFSVLLVAQIGIMAILRSNRRAIETAIDAISDAATHDALTGVENIHAFRADLIDETINSGNPSIGPALVIVDINDFGGFNRAGGHAAGDRVLREVAARLADVAGRLGDVYRIDCDEFAVLLGPGREEFAKPLADRVREALRFYPQTGLRQAMPVTVAVGAAVWRPGMTTEELVDEAQRSMAGGKPPPDRGGGRSSATML